MQTPPKDGLTPVRKANLTIRFVKSLYLVIHTLVVLAVLLGAGALYLAFRPDGLTLVKTFFLEPLGIHISRAEGSLSEGFSLHDLHSKAIDAKTLTLDYNLTTILKGEHVIDKITIDGLQIHVDDFISQDSPSLPLPLFTLKEVTLTNLQLISSYPIELNIQGQNGGYDGENLNFSSIQATIKSQYASGALRGSLKNNAIQGTALLYPNGAELQPTVGRFATLHSPQKIVIDELSDTRVKLHASLDYLESLNDPLTSLRAIALSMDYRYENDYLDFKADYLLMRDGQQMQTAQELRYSLSGVTTSTFKGVITSNLPLPSHTIVGKFRDDAEGIAGKLTLGNTTLSLQSGDYDTYAWNLETPRQTLDFLPALPETLRSSPFSINAKGGYVLKNNLLTGKFNAHNDHGEINGSLSYENELFGLNINGSGGAFFLSFGDHRLKGSGSFLGTSFEITGTHSAAQSDVTITSLTPSVWKTLTQIGSIELHHNEYYDAEVRTSTHITYDTALRISTDIHIPWYAAVLDSQHQYGGTNSTFSVRYREGALLVDAYRFDIANHTLISQRPSSMHINDEGNLMIDELWIFDGLRLSGEIDTFTFATELALHSDRFDYSGPEGEADAAADLLFTRDNNGIQTLTGNIQLFNAKITYLPLQQFKIMDDDVIIVQDVRPPSDTSLFVNIQVTAQNPLHYLTDELDLFIQPDLTLWKEPTGPIELLGMVTIPRGRAKTSGKEFELKTSHLYFGGGGSINPYLDFIIAHDVDYKKIQIYITHTLDSPIFLFSSDPFMSQNNIMSYLLFGSPADSELNSDGSKTAMKTDATNFMLGAGIKGLINGATKMQIDTMNILTTQEGSMGFEVGAHLNKDLRVLYKNDTVSSVLIQYQLNRWLRLDADIHELGQGINAIYIKDFRDFLSRNSVKKEKN